MYDNNTYLVYLDNEQYGPYSLRSMREMMLLADTLVKKLPDGDFIPASSYPELIDYLMVEEQKNNYNSQEQNNTQQSQQNQQSLSTNFNLDTASFFYKENGDMFGPYSIWELSLLDLVEDSELSIDNMQTWTTAKNIPGLLEMIHQISGEDEIGRIIAAHQQISLDKDELERVIRDQEKDLIEKLREISSKDKILADQQWEMANRQREIAELQKEIERLKRSDAEKEQILREKEQELLKLQMLIEIVPPQTTVVEQPWVERPTFDLSSDYRGKFVSFADELERAFSSLKGLLPQKEKYVRVFHSHNDEIEYHLDEYRHSMDSLDVIIAQIEKIMTEATEAYNEDVRLLDGSLSKLQYNIIQQQNTKMRAAEEDTQKQILELANVSMSGKESIMDVLKRNLGERKMDITRQLNIEKQKGNLRINQVKNEISTLYGKLQSMLHQAEIILQELEKQFSAFFDQSYDMASASSEIWNRIEDNQQLPPTRLLLGCEEKCLHFEGIHLTARKRVFYDFLNCKHLMIRYNKATKEKAEGFVNTLLARLIASSRPGNVQVSMIDTEDMSGTSNVFTRLNRRVYSLCVKSDDVRKLIDWVKDHIADIKVNLLQSPISNLLEYNQKKENKEPYQVLVIKGFPFGLVGDTLSMLNSILRNGIDAGVNVIMLTDDDELEGNDDAKKQIARISEDALQKCRCIDFARQQIDSKPLCNLEMLSEETLTNIVHYANKGFEVRDDEKVLLSDYIPAEDDWWSGHSANHVDIPFGLDEDRQVQKLRIARTGGSNSAVVIGVSGSGKSVFLHTIICSSAISYSPDELQLYLIDFSGVEFNTYANHKLPHARVIAPEAEREFGLSVLRELAEEGARRMAIFRDNDVNTIADLKEKNPQIKMPRLLVIIDEFQKLFEIENDKISQEANSKIFMIVKEFGKFGINLILATQELMSSSVLPKDLIANRVVFKSKPNDFSSLISLPSNSRMPLLNAGECIYNNSSGSPYANSRVKGFFAKKSEIDNLLVRLYNYSQAHNQSADDLIVFRGNDLPLFGERRIEERHRYITDIPEEVGVYFGESIAINDTDVCATICKEAGNNILVIGGETDVAQRIAYYSTLSTTTSHTDYSAQFFVFNFIRGSENEIAEINETLMSLPFNVKMANKLDDVTEYLTEIHTEIEARKNDETRPLNHIYLSFYAFQLARMFEIGGHYNDEPSECSEKLDFILRVGPAYGVFTILQMDNLDSLAKIGTSVNAFNYRICMQMTEEDSFKLIGTSIANKLFVFNRPSSKYRAYFRDNNRNLTIKFKPYK